MVEGHLGGISARCSYESWASVGSSRGRLPAQYGTKIFTIEVWWTPRQWR